MSGEEDRVVEDLGLVAPLLASLGGYQARLVWDRAANTDRGWLVTRGELRWGAAGCQLRDYRLPAGDAAGVLVLPRGEVEGLRAAQEKMKELKEEVASLRTAHKEVEELKEEVASLAQKEVEELRLEREAIAGREAELRLAEENLASKVREEATRAVALEDKQRKLEEQVVKAEKDLKVELAKRKVMEGVLVAKEKTIKKLVETKKVEEAPIKDLADDMVKAHEETKRIEMEYVELVQRLEAKVLNLEKSIKNQPEVKDQKKKLRVAKLCIKKLKKRTKNLEERVIKAESDMRECQKVSGVKENELGHLKEEICKNETEIKVQNERLRRASKEIIKYQTESKRQKENLRKAEDDLKKYQAVIKHQEGKLKRSEITAEHKHIETKAERCRLKQIEMDVKMYKNANKVQAEKLKEAENEVKMYRSEIKSQEVKLKKAEEEIESKNLFQKKEIAEVLAMCEAELKEVKEKAEVDKQAIIDNLHSVNQTIMAENQKKLEEKVAQYESEATETAKQYMIAIQIQKERNQKCWVKVQEHTRPGEAPSIYCPECALPLHLLMVAAHMAEVHPASTEVALPCRLCSLPVPPRFLEQHWWFAPGH